MVPIASTRMIRDQFYTKPHYSLEMPPVVYDVFLAREPVTDVFLAREPATDFSAVAIVQSLALQRINSPYSYSASRLLNEQTTPAEKSSLRIVAYEYRAILSEILTPLSFSMADSYEDAFGGKVLDCFRSAERITCIISSQCIQVLSFLDGTFNDKTFKRSGETKVDIFKYVEGLFSGTEKSGELDCAQRN